MKSGVFARTPAVSLSVVEYNVLELVDFLEHVEATPAVDSLRLRALQCRDGIRACRQLRFATDLTALLLRKVRLLEQDAAPYRRAAVTRLKAGAARAHGSRRVG